MRLYGPFVVVIAGFVGFAVLMPPLLRCCCCRCCCCCCCCCRCCCCCCWCCCCCCCSNSFRCVCGFLGCSCCWCCCCCCFFFFLAHFFAPECPRLQEFLRAVTRSAIQGDRSQPSRSARQRGPRAGRARVRRRAPQRAATPAKRLPAPAGMRRPRVLLKLCVYCGRYRWRVVVVGGGRTCCCWSQAVRHALWVGGLK